MKKQIYLDNGATTPVLPEVREKMLPYFTEKFGNPSSIHKIGQTVRIAVEDARAYVAEALHTQPARITFTSGGTESDISAIVGYALAHQEEGKHIIISAIEHSAVIEATNLLKNFGFDITYLEVDEHGKISLDQLKESIREDTILISIMYVNNELGTIQPIEEIGEIAKENNICFHTDAVQAFPISEIDLSELPIDLLTISSHKINGPKGVGALYIKRGIKILPIFGGTQERSKRGGTENVPGIVGFGEAVRILMQTREDKKTKAYEYRNLLINRFQESLDEESFVVNGHPTEVVPNILNVSFPGTDSHTMIAKLDMKGIAVSGGSACAAGSVDISRVLKALNIAEDITKSSIRISFGVFNTTDEIEKTAKEIINIVKSTNHKRK